MINLERIRRWEQIEIKTKPTRWRLNDLNFEKPLTYVTNFFKKFIQKLS